MSDKTPQEFIKQFPPSMRNPISMVLNGQLATVKAYEAYESYHDDSPTTGQHPKYAYAGDSNPESATKFGVGSGLLGETLVYRVPGSFLTQADGDKLTARAEAFLALVKMKHIDHVVMSTNGNSEVVDILAKADINGLQSLSGEHPIVQKVAKERVYLSERVRKNGWGHYKAMGLDMSGTPLQMMKKALVAEIGFENIRASRNMQNSPDVMFVAEFPESGDYFHWNEKTGKFVPVPALGNVEETQKYLSALPEKVQDLGVKIINGRARLSKAMEEEGGIRVSNVSSSSCTDSRTAMSTVVGGVQELACHVLRTPGNIWTEADGSLSPETSLFLALAARRGDVVIKANEATCGAMTAIDAYNSDPDGVGKTLPPAFQNLGQQGTNLYTSVQKSGIDAYRDAGVAVQDRIACLALETLIYDVGTATRDTGGSPIITVYQNIPERQNYVLHPTRGEFLRVPSIPELSPARPEHIADTTQVPKPAKG